MANILYLVHRLPYPPNKGDKVRSYHLLKHLATHHQVFLGTFIDDPADDVHRPTVTALCADMYAAPLTPLIAKLRSLVALATGQALTLRYYRDNSLHAWVRQTQLRHKIDAVVVFSSAMGQYVNANANGDADCTLLVDFVDVDSAKWAQYGDNHRWPLSWLYRREGKTLLAYERALARQANKAFFVTDAETAMFRQLAPDCAGVVDTMSNGVDSDYFAPDPARGSPFGAPEAGPEFIAIVFTGAMDYWPNVDAVTWFVKDILPELHRTRPGICFYIVGRSPPPTVLNLADKRVVVTGTVADVRPYLQHAAVVVAPLRVARGIQNKILEAMAMARPIVASESCTQAMNVSRGEDISAAQDSASFVREINALLAAPLKATAMGQAGRSRVVKNYSWSAHLSRIDSFLERPVPRPRSA